MQKSNSTIRTLWHGPALSVYEELSLVSFVRCGHAVEVYSYGPLKVPIGVSVCDANMILPQSEIFSYTQGLAKGSFAAFSNLFRFKLLKEKGGIWADSDVLCLKPLDDLPDVCGGRVDENWLNGAILKFPPNHPICNKLCNEIDALGANIALGQTAELITAAFTANSEDCNVLPPAAFYPIHSKNTWMLLDPEQRERCEELSKESYCVHWWNAVLTLAIGVDKDALPPEGSYLYDKARTVLSTQKLKAWPLEAVESWIENQKTASKAEQAAKAKDWSKAIGLWRAALDGFGDQAPPDIWANLSQAHRQNSDFNAAERVLEEAAIKYPSNCRLAREHAEIAMARGDWALAVERWQRLLTEFFEKSRPRDYTRLSRALRAQDRGADAESVLLQRMSIQPSSLELDIEFAEIATAREDWQAAADRWQSLLNQYGTQSPGRAYARLSQALRRQGDFEAAYKLICLSIRRGLKILT